MKTDKRIGIIDIGSNSVRLVVYEITSHSARRVVDEGKKAVRLSERIGPDGRLPHKEILALAETLRHFKMLCNAQGAVEIRAVATAAVRNAANSVEIADLLIKHTGMNIEVLSGQEEARLGFVGMINAMNVKNGFLIDIGGGSTELTLFRNRQVVQSVSIPFGAVNMARSYSQEGVVNDEQLRQIRSMVTEAMRKEKWISGNGGLPLVGLGGTIRSLGKLVQRSSRYSLPLTHNFRMSGETVDEVLDKLMDLSPDRRSRFDGITKERSDIIVPGIILLQSVFRYIGASHYLVSGTGLRDGLFYETSFPGKDNVPDVLEFSVRNLLRLHPSVPLLHVEQVDRLARTIFEGLREMHKLDRTARTYLHVACLLYRIGVTVNYYSYPKHTFYIMAHARIDGLTHREILICALAASYKNRHRTRRQYLAYKDILNEADCRLAVTLGSILQLASALDRSESQPVAKLSVKAGKKTLELSLHCRHTPVLEIAQAATLEKEFKKVWGLSLRCREEEPSNS